MLPVASSATGRGVGGVIAVGERYAISPTVIPGHRGAMGYDVQSHIRESILTIAVMDSGLALRAPRNDE